MKEYQKPIEQTEEEFDELQTKLWLADSHYWIYKYQTYYCKWCGKPSQTGLGLDGDAYLCPKNPEIIKALKGKG